MVRVVDCHAGVLGSNPGGPKIFSPWNYFKTKPVVLLVMIVKPDFTINVLGCSAGSDIARQHGPPNNFGQV